MIEDSSQQEPSERQVQIFSSLDRVLCSRTFQSAERAKSLLQFLVERAAQGSTVRLKEYEVGVEALRKDASFDPRTDPIVRAEVSRLRSRLERYYDREGKSDSLRIVLPKGTYLPLFEDRIVPSFFSFGFLGAEIRGSRSLRALARFISAVAFALCLFALIVWDVWSSATQRGPVTIAVLPFANLSEDPGQDYFSEGITEEIATALTQIKQLHVVARGSTLNLAEDMQDLSNVGNVLHASYLVQGSVRKAGTRVRVATHIVSADDGVSLWANTYDREVTDVFAIQEEIAASVAAAVLTPLGLATAPMRVSMHRTDPETYDIFLRGRAALRLRSRNELDLLTEVVTRDPHFAPGWAKLSEARREMALYYERGGEAWRQPILLKGAETAARKAIAIDPEYSGGYAALTAVLARRGQWAEAMQAAMRGLEYDPEDPELLNNYANLLRALGYLKDALRIRKQLTLIEPLNPLFDRQEAEIMLANGLVDEGIMRLEALNERGLGQPSAVAVLYLAPAYAAQGQYISAANLLLDFLELNGGPANNDVIQVASRVLQTNGKIDQEAHPLPDFDSQINFVYAHTGESERMLDWPEKALRSGDYRPLQQLWWPTPSNVRTTERFRQLVRDAGIVDYWRSHGWPDKCFSLGGDDFECN